MAGYGDKKFEHKPNNGSVFNNDRKEKPNHPDRAGDAMLECPHCGKTWASWVNGWIKENKNGKFLSLAFKPKEQRSEQRGGGDRGGGSRDRDFDDDGGGFRGGAGRQSGGAPQRTNWERDLKDDVPF